MPIDDQERQDRQEMKKRLQAFKKALSDKDKAFMVEMAQDQPSTGDVGNPQEPV